MNTKRLIGTGIVLVVVLLSGILLLNTGGYLAAAGLGLTIGGIVGLVVGVIGSIIAYIKKQ